MKNCSICKCEITSDKYQIPSLLNKPLCEECHKRLNVCLANKDNAETQKAWEILAEQTEGIKDAEVLDYLTCIVMPPEEDDSQNRFSSNIKKQDLKASPKNGAVVSKNEVAPKRDTVTEMNESGIFANIGSKIKGISKAIFWLNTISCITIGIILFVQDSRYYSTGGLGVVIILFGPFLAWVASLFSYGFGELIEQTTRHNQLLSELISKSNKNKTK